MKLRTRLSLWYTSVMAASGCILILVLYFVVAHKLEREAEKFLHDEYQEMERHTLAGIDSPAELEAAIQRGIETGRYFPLAYRLHDPSASEDVIVAVAPRWLEHFRAEPIPDVSEGDTVFSVVQVGRYERKFWLLSRQISVNDRTYILQVGIYVKRLHNALRALRIYLSIALVVMTGVAFVGGRFLAGRSLRPIDSIASDLETIESQDVSRRIPSASSGDEVQQLRSAVNRMLDRLEQGFSQVQAFTADAAHELRTPLSALRCRLEVATGRSRSAQEYRMAMTDAMACLVDLEALVVDLLLLSRLEVARETFEREPVDIPALLRDLQETFSAVAEQKGIRLELDIGDGCFVLGNSNLLHRLFGNLLDNAMKYTGEGGTIRARVAAEGERCVVTIEDTGIGIAREEQQKIFRRFYRADQSRSRESGGTGLGLSIAQTVAQFHGGQLRLESESGMGTKATVFLPRIHPRKSPPPNPE